MAGGIQNNLEVYRDIFLSQVPRILSFCNRNPGSPTFGCFDRNYWHYRQIDLPNARWQEAVLLLALVYKYDFPGNIYYRKEKIKEWVIGGINFWEKIQAQDGSQSEYYPNERSFCCTSFSTYAVTESIIILGLDRKKSAIINSGRWLSTHINIEVANQVAGSIIALENIYLITNDNHFKKAAVKKLDILLNEQDDLGVFPEYGGYDVGYQSITISYLAKYFKMTKEIRLEKPLYSAIEFINNKIDDYGDYDHLKTSRKTQYLYPHGFVLMGSYKVVSKHISGLIAGKLLNPAWMDDRYCIHLSIDYLQAFLEGISSNAHDHF